MTPDERKAWDLYCQRQVATSAEAQTTIPAQNAGADMVPTTLYMQIIANAAFFGGMSDVSRFMNFSNPTTGQFMIPRVTDNETKKAKILAENTDADLDRVATDNVVLTPRNTVVQVPFSDQMLLSGNANLRAFIDSDVPEWFGRAFNEWYTRGTGTGTPGQPKGVAVISTGATTTAANSAVTEAEISSMVASMDAAYFDRPGTVMQAHWTTILWLQRQRLGTQSAPGERLYPLTQDRQSVILPGGLIPERNNDCLPFNGVAVTSRRPNPGATSGNPTQNSDRVLFQLGDLRSYGRITASGMMAESARGTAGLKAFQWLFSWNIFQDAAPLNDNAFKRLLLRV